MRRDYQDPPVPAEMDGTRAAEIWARVLATKACPAGKVEHLALTVRALADEEQYVTEQGKAIKVADIEAVAKWGAMLSSVRNTIAKLLEGLPQRRAD